MEFTGERLVPGVEGLEDLYTEHVSRYMLAAALARSKRVLDVGCGCGYGTHLLALAGSAEALGIDISPEAVGFARSRYAREGLDYRTMDARKIDLAGSFGLITCFELIEHVREDSDVVKSLARATADDGVCLISTPNADTYVAGGEGGDNPFHCREYRRDEFEDLLRAEFEGVTMLEQRWTGGMIISPCAGGGKPGVPDGIAVVQPDEMGLAPEAGSWGPAPYFLAACSKSGATPTPDTLKRAFVAVASDARYRKLKEEFDQRGRWARKLDAEVREKDVLISRLRDEKASLEREFDERGQWAQGLDREIRDKDKLINKLMAEIDHLKRTAAMTGK